MQEIVRNTIKENGKSITRLICEFKTHYFICDINKNPLTKGYNGARLLLENHGHLIIQ